MLDNLLSLLAPHICSGCQKSGTLLCANCEYDIISEPFSYCVSCGKGVPDVNGRCGGCTVPYQRAWCVADRRDHLQRLINDFKFMNTKSAYLPLAKLLDAYLPELPDNVVIVPVPTVNRHIRQRGYDHMLLIAQRLGKTRSISVETHLKRATNTVQRSAGAKLRAQQASKAFAVSAPLDSDAIYLVLDDVVTTGSTVRYASQALLDAGATTVWVASISRQPLD
jgi:ComF family protein